MTFDLRLELAFIIRIQILEFFDCEVEAQEIENRLIKPDLNNPMCLNEHYGSIISTAARTQGGILCANLGKGCHSKEIRSKGGKNAVASGHLKSVSSKAGKSSNAQKWACLETGFISNSGNLAQYHKRRGIDPSRRKRLS